ncbi:GntR family transcriptional regulator [Mobilisporobacter senegalensis]|uniref:GntR family transcriptional regulator n=1 Tax=Mobilisporobacter senegalensis TaxID=1329262 RepID=A0A3N1X5X4_9FIRM|nr:GntR family transcriptional regulator [Mobilisporobacter senegalensis]ROR22163.1 GntR family transcriptional regulator [Mobilisporobacter senegalensis]
MKLKTSLGDKPLWSQVYDILVDRMNQGVYEAGSILPPEVQIMEEFGVSRITVRQAMDRLISEELISRKRGKGTVVLERKDRASTVFQSSFDKVTEVQGNINKEVLSVKMVTPSPEVRYAFELSENQLVLELVRLNRDNHGNVLTIHYSYLNPITELTTKDDYSISLYKVLTQKGYPIEAVIEEITAKISDGKEKQIFKLRKDVAIITRLRKGYNGKQLVEYSISKYNSEGYTLIINSN